MPINTVCTTSRYIHHSLLFISMKYNANFKRTSSTGKKQMKLILMQTNYIDAIKIFFIRKQMMVLQIYQIKSGTPYFQFCLAQKSSSHSSYFYVQFYSYSSVIIFHKSFFFPLQLFIMRCDKIVFCSVIKFKKSKNITNGMLRSNLCCYENV